jgi:adenosylcobinamide-GDP ribazoletransferase
MRELLAALTFLTRFPVSPLLREAPVPVVRALWAFPVVGALIGAIGAAAFAACARVPALAAVLAFGATLLATGALHEDGLADTADGPGGGATRERALEIMRDSRIGTYGALALIVTLAARTASLAAIADPARTAPALVVSGALGRAFILPLVLLLSPARPGGVAATLRERNPVNVACGLIVPTVIICALLRGTAVPVCVAALVATCVLGIAARRRLGGYTGDVLGAGVVLAESAALAAIALSSG